MSSKPEICGVCDAGAYSEHAAWLQRGRAGVKNSFAVQAGAGVSGFALQECRAGIDNLCTGAGDAPDTVTVSLKINSSLPAEGYRLTGAAGQLVIEGADANGLLYGVYTFLLRLAAGDNPEQLNTQSAPAVPHRVINHWDRMDGTVERGYAGKSIFFKNNALDYDPQRVRDYARLLASIGVNGICINNMNVTLGSVMLICDEQLPLVARLADIFRDFGIRVALSVGFESPSVLGGIPMQDPLASAVVNWWAERTSAIYSQIPDFLGFVVKADSEFQSGPSAMGISQAQGANLLARALAPHGGIVFWRCFIYNCLQDWRDTQTDRPMAAYALFKDLDGQFDDNVILQIKNGPSDFQVREPNSPLFGAMPGTRQGLELQITQEYTGQQIDLYCLAVHWEEVLDAPGHEPGHLRDLIGGAVQAVSAISNVGDDDNWTGHTLAQANLFAFGRLAWNPKLAARDIVHEWARLTFGAENGVAGEVAELVLGSRAVYENYTTPMGLCWMVNIHHHYGPSPEGYEFMKWGTYHRANAQAIGVDRSSRGTGYAGQYAPPLAKVYNEIDTCPQELLLYFHRVAYNHVLPDGRTLLQTMYDSHFEGAQAVEGFISRWEALKPVLPAAVYASVHARLLLQLENAREWRDVVNTYFYRKTGIADERGRQIYP